MTWTNSRTSPQTCLGQSKDLSGQTDRAFKGPVLSEVRSVRAPVSKGEKNVTMLNETDREAALALMMTAGDETMMKAVDGEIRRTFPNIETGELVALWREAGERQIAEANALEAYGAQRRVR